MNILWNVMNILLQCGKLECYKKIYNVTKNYFGTVLK